MARIAPTLCGVGITFAAADRSMSLMAKWSSSDYAALVAIGQITAAFASAAVARMEAQEATATADIAAFLLAGIDISSRSTPATMDRTRA